MVHIFSEPIKNIRFCPKCGAENINYSEWWQEDGSLFCNKCGLKAYIVDDRESRLEDEEEHG